LQQGATLLGPVGLEFENDLLKSQHASGPAKRWQIRLQVKTPANL